MVIFGDLGVSATLSLYRSHSNSSPLRASSSPSLKEDFHHILHKASSTSGFTPKISLPEFGQEAENCLLNAGTINFPEHLNLAWKIIFPSAASKNSNARISQIRLKMILFYDRCVLGPSTPTPHTMKAGVQFRKGHNNGHTDLIALILISLALFMEGFPFDLLTNELRNTSIQRTMSDYFEVLENFDEASLVACSSDLCGVPAFIFLLLCDHFCEALRELVVSGDCGAIIFEDAYALHPNIRISFYLWMVVVRGVRSQEASQFELCTSSILLHLGRARLAQLIDNELAGCLNKSGQTPGFPLTGP
ncbi:hypothetical protein VNO77_02872 [Canavalia gladiata]|uniref:Uncharacterized protein n=1 Tax=Canavalia gladiata TaxID=3824 RepID=A0AAN9MUI9_CANGL